MKNLIFSLILLLVTPVSICDLQQKANHSPSYTYDDETDRPVESGYVIRHMGGMPGPSRK